MVSLKFSRILGMAQEVSTGIEAFGDIGLLQGGAPGHFCRDSLLT